MRISWDSEALGELDQVEAEIQQRIKQSIEELEDEPLPDNSYVIQLPDGTEIQCLKLQEEDRNSQLNHRVTYDIEEDTSEYMECFLENQDFKISNRKQLKENKNAFL